MCMTVRTTSLHIDRPEVVGQLPGLDPAEIQNVVDDAEQMLLAALDAPEVTQLLPSVTGPARPIDSSSVYPPIALSGVRSSCDIAARN